MKKNPSYTRKHRAKQVASTVSAAALMLGISHAATVAMHFQVNYCGYAGYTGLVVTTNAFGVPASGWQNLTPMNSGYTSCPFSGPPYGYTLSQTVSTNTSTGGLNPLPSGTININWSANTANFSGFGGYVDATNSPPYNIDVVNQVGIVFGGEDQIYFGFLRDGINFGPPGGADNTGGFGGYNVDMTGLKSVFPTTPFVVELIAASDSMQVLTNAFVIDVTGSTTNSVTYPSTAPVADAGGAPWTRGHGGGLSTATGSMNTDHLHIMSNLPQHGGSGGPPTGYDNAGTISGFIITDKPVVTMSPRSVMGFPGDTVALSAYAIGVPPLSYQWRKNGLPIGGATNLSYTVANLGKASGGNYDLLVTNAYGSATSKVSAVTVDMLALTPGTNFVADSNPANPERDGLNNGASWLATSSDGTTTRSGVMQFVAISTNGITVPGDTNFNSSTGSFAFWMRSAGTDPNSIGNTGAALFGRPGSGGSAYDLILVQNDSGNLLFNAPGTLNYFNSGNNVSDNKWHLVVLTYDGSINGGATLYIDGALDTTNGNNGPWTPPGSQLEIGLTSGGMFRAYNGQLDDVRFYNRELTAAEVSSIYSSASLVDTSALQMQLNFSTAPVAGFSLGWAAPNSVLQSSPSVTGTFSDVLGAVSPYYVIPRPTQKYYRYRFPNSPQSRQSNPYLM